MDDSIEMKLRFKPVRNEAKETRVALPPYESMQSALQGLLVF
ncbi:hypothetical protein [Burkholderia sp. Se-20373]|nr:hypothetical protein [Burkholderia sp. Se-20373]